MSLIVTQVARSLFSFFHLKMDAFIILASNEKKIFKFINNRLVASDNKLVDYLIQLFKQFQWVFIGFETSFKASNVQT